MPGIKDLKSKKLEQALQNQLQTPIYAKAQKALGKHGVQTADFDKSEKDFAKERKQLQKKLEK